nr:glycosyltransferase family 4 protein [uncultured Desulfobulbus sp.]
MKISWWLAFRGKTIPQLEGIRAAACRFVHFEQGQLDFLLPGMSDVMPYPSAVFGQLTIAQIERYEEAFSEVLDQAVEACTPDIIHSHHLWLASAIIRKRFPSLAMVTSCHSTDLRQFQQCPHLRERGLTPCQQIDRILALSRYQAAQIQALYKIPAERIDIVGGGFDSARFSLQKKEAGPPVQLLSAGKLSLAKGVDCLLRAIRSFDPRRVHLHLVGSGSGPEEQCCLALAREAGDLVSVQGRLNQEELARLMGQFMGANGFSLGSCKPSVKRRMSLTPVSSS